MLLCCCLRSVLQGAPLGLPYNYISCREQRTKEKAFRSECVAVDSRANASDRTQTLSNGESLFCSGLTGTNTPVIFGPHWGSKKERERRSLFLYLILWHYLLWRYMFPQPLINKGFFLYFRQKNLYIDIQKKGVYNWNCSYQKYTPI